MQRKEYAAVTLKDIAERTGYSVNTVSRALRGKDDISEATRELIKKTAEEMGHIGNGMAASLRSGYSNTIAVILGDVSNLHFATMMKEIEVCASAKGYTSILLNTNEDVEQESKAIQVALSRNVDGIIICPTQKNEDSVEFLKRVGLPFVLIGRRYEDAAVNYVICNDELGGYQATKHLLQMGHQRILMLHGPMYISSAAERLAGYVRAHEELGIPVQPELIWEVPVMANGCEHVLEQIQERGISFSAIFAFSDMLAWEAWSCLRKRGIRVPEECSIIGFDHIQSVLPLPFNLTSIAAAKEKMAPTAVELLLASIQNRENTPRHILLPTRVVEGETVRAI